jgi:RNase P/RNase MRP subunit p29
MIYIVTSTTTNVPNLSTGPVMGVHGSLKEANAHMNMCIRAALVDCTKLCWDIANDSDSTAVPRSMRRAMIAHPDGGSTVIAIQGWDIKRAKRTVKPAVPSEVLAETLDTLIGGDDDDSVENA